MSSQKILFKRLGYLSFFVASFLLVSCVSILDPFLRALIPEYARICEWSERLELPDNFYRSTLNDLNQPEGVEKKEALYEDELQGFSTKDVCEELYKLLGKNNCVYIERFCLDYPEKCKEVKEALKACGVGDCAECIDCKTPRSDEFLDQGPQESQPDFCSGNVNGNEEGAGY